MPMPKGRLGIGAPGRVICTPPLLPSVSTFSEPPHPLQKIDFHPDALISLFWIVCITSLQPSFCHKEHLLFSIPGSSGTSQMRTMRAISSICDTRVVS
ncbi:hypothetical protein Peur_057432 [Populus x canadensis]